MSGAPTSDSTASDAGGPPRTRWATLRVRVTGERAPSVVGFLRELQRSESLIGVNFGDGPGGALVKITSGTMTLVLERDD